MRKSFLLLVAFILSSFVHAEEKPASDKIVAAGLFKNGLAVIKREVVIPASGECILTDTPEPVHGTFWVESDTPVEVHSAMREVEEDLSSNTNINFQDSLAGKTVTVTLRDKQLPVSITGTVVKVNNGGRKWQRNYQNNYRYYNSRLPQPQPRASGRFLLLKTEDGYSYIDFSSVVYLQVKGGQSTILTNKPAITLHTSNRSRRPVKATLTYLEKGLSWAPAYKVNLLNDNLLSIAQQATVKNELGDLLGTKISLISGYPRIQFAHVTSPLSLKTNWQNFFNQLNQEFRPGHASTRNAMVQGQRITSPDSSTDGLNIPQAYGKGVDLHYQSVGEKTLLEGESMLVPVAEAQARYTHIVEWIIPDTRKPNGRYIQNYERNQNPEKYEDAAWDAVRFNNPFKFPMTTCAASIYTDGNFSGQNMSNWVNPGEETTLHITKALSLRTRHTEQEEKGVKRANIDIVYIGGNDFRKVNVKGEIAIDSHRNEPVNLVIRRRFSGELKQADGNPKASLREEGVYSVNKRNELTWTVTLKPGEKLKLTYSYSVLVDN